MTNEYTPWVETEETELGYYKRRFLEESARVEELQRLIHRVIDELGDPTYERWCDSPAPDRELLEQLLRDLKREVKDGSD